jgi:hypothetical protein
MIRSDLIENFIDNPGALLKKTRAKLKKTHSISRLEVISESEDHTDLIRSLTPEFEAMANKSVCEFSAPTMDNIRTGPAADIDRPFELKPADVNWGPDLLKGSDKFQFGGVMTQFDLASKQLSPKPCNHSTMPPLVIDHRCTVDLTKKAKSFAC